MITTTEAPTWLRRSDQAVTWARTMLTPGRAVVIDCETTDLPGAITGRMRYQKYPNSLRSFLAIRRGAGWASTERPEGSSAPF